MTESHVSQQNIDPFVIAHRVYALEVVRRGRNLFNAIAPESGQIPEPGYDQGMILFCTTSYASFQVRSRLS